MSSSILRFVDEKATLCRLPVQFWKGNRSQAPGIYSILLYPLATTFALKAVIRMRRGNGRYVLTFHPLFPLYQLHRYNKCAQILPVGLACSYRGDTFGILPTSVNLTITPCVFFMSSHCSCFLWLLT